MIGVEAVENLLKKLNASIAGVLIIGVTCVMKKLRSLRSIH